MTNEFLFTHAELFLDKKLNIVTNLANMSAIIMQNISDLNWVGFYLYDGEKLYLGPFQGKAAVTIIDMGKGVCGTSASKREILIVDDVHKFPGHIPCDCDSNSEIVLPIVKNGELFGVLDIDSPIQNRFDENTAKDLEKLVKLLVDIL
ncbi:MAG: GAF domain-containing protein [Candidatus Izemoplasmatales bacterium]